MKYIKLFQDDSERIPFETNEYEEPYVSLTLKRPQYSATIGGGVVNVEGVNDGSYLIYWFDMDVELTINSDNCLLLFTSNSSSSEHVELPSTAATDGQDATFEVSGTTYYGKWMSQYGLSWWQLYETSDYSGDGVGAVYRFILTSYDLGQLFHYNKSKIVSLTLNDDSTVEIKDFIDGNAAVYDSMISPYCETVVSAVIEKGVSSIGGGAFYNCSGLTSVSIPNSVTSIGSYAFQRCSGLTNITIPSSVTSIGELAFYYCVNLTAITFEDPTKIASLGYNGDYMFGDCYNLESINITEDTPWTFMPRRGFMRCYKLKSIVIPNSVTDINGMALCNCSSLTEITIPSGVTSIGMEAFYGCSGLTSITCLATTPPQCTGTQVFKGINANCQVYVPSESVAAYKAASQWSAFGNRIQAIPQE